MRRCVDIAAWIVAACVLLGAAGGCRAPESTSQEVGRFALTDVGGYLEFVARDRRDKQSSKVGAGDTRRTETIFEESVRLETEGYVYHPNLMEFAAGGLFGLLQYQFEDEYGNQRRSASDDGEIYEFDLSADLLQRKLYPGSVHARRRRSIEARPFLSSLETTTTNYGLIWQYADEKTPTSFQFSNTQVDLVPLGSEEEPGYQENTNWRFETAYRINDGNAFSFVFNRLSVEERPFELSYDSNEATLSHKYHFGEAGAHRLESEINYFDQTGTFDIRRLRWRENLRLVHTDHLRTRYQFELIQREQGNLFGVEPVDETSYRGFVELEHRLYDSLVSQFQLWGNRQRFKSGLDIERYGAFANFNYRKTNPVGELFMDYRFGVVREDRQGTEESLEVLDERHTFRDPEPIVLTNPQVILSSIFITAEDRTTAYQSGRDYNVLLRGERIEIERIPTGRILDGQVVLIDYVFRIGGNFTLDTLTQDIRVRQEFDFGLSPYYRLRWQDQTIAPLDARGALAEDITSHTLGVEYRLKALRLMAEWQDHDSTITPYEALRLSADYTHRFSFGATGIVKARWSDVTYRPPVARDVRFLTVEGRYRHPITEGLNVEGAVLYRNETDSLSGDDEGVDFDFSLEWIVRQTEMRITYEYGTYEDDFASNDSQALFVRVRRRF